MKSKILTSILVGGVCLGALQMGPALAKEDELERMSRSVTTTSKFVAEEKEDQRLSIDEIRKHRDRDNVNKNIEEMLAKYGISTEGKTMEEIQEELKGLEEQLLKEKARELGISVENKDYRTLLKEVKSKIQDKQLNDENKKDLILQRRGESLLQEKMFQDYLNKYGINTNGKTPEELQQALKEAMLKEKSKELNISLDGKSEKELLEEIKEAQEKKQ